MQSKWLNSVSIKVKNNNFDCIENFTGFGKLHVSSDHENYYYWNKFQNCTVGKGTDITLLHYTCII